MSRSLKVLAIACGLVFTAIASAQSQDVDAGKKVFKKCAACHTVGDGAKNKVGPHLNSLFGREAGTLQGFKYSKAMIAAGQEGLVWDEANVTEFVAKPKALVRKTKMAFAGLRKEQDRTNLIAFLKMYSSSDQPEQVSKAAETGNKAPKKKTATAIPAPRANEIAVPTHGVLHLGRSALPEEIAAWDIDIRPDGQGLPQGRGTVTEGEAIYSEVCAACHGDFGEGIDRWPVLAGGLDTLTEERPEKTIGSYWPYLSTVFDYVRRAMPFGDARSLSDDDVYAITAYLLYLNDVVEDEDFELSHENFASIRLPNEGNFVPDDRQEEAHYADANEPCMTDCRPDAAKVLMRARVLDVTPDEESDDNAGAGAID